MSSTNLLNEFGQPCPRKIEDETDRRLVADAGMGAGYLAQKRPLTRDVVLGLAIQQSSRFGKTPAEVRLLDIDEELQALEYAYNDRAERERSRSILRSDAAELRRAELRALVREAA